MKQYIVITAIHGRTPAIDAFAARNDWHTVVIGDQQSVPIAPSDNLTYLSLDDQASLDFAFTEHCPCNHYTRKNIGYLYAMSQGADVLYETDDDNAPTADWAEPAWTCAQECTSDSRFVNVYQYFTDEHVWPRGFPLEHIHSTKPSVRSVEPRQIGIWQGLADGDPDVDAVFRLVFKAQTVTFAQNEPFCLQDHVYCPFNSQCTFWRKDAFPLLYLPATVSFRFTDILRGYVAQRLLWEQDLQLGFHAPTVTQDRNEHNLLEDLAQEVESYLAVSRLVSLLEAQSFSGDIFDDMSNVYAALAEANLVTSEERGLCDAWLQDCRAAVETVGEMHTGG